MKYQLIEDYFETPLFQRAVQDYFDTVLGRMMAENMNLSAKGLFIVNGEQKRDYYDMPYHIHILNGLIPALFVYEQYLLRKGWTEEPEADTYLRIFMLGFTFHDANKLLQVQQTEQKSDLEEAVGQLAGQEHRWSVEAFFPEYDAYRTNVYYLALSTEDGTWVSAEDYPITVKNKDEVKVVQRELCHLADGLASIQNEELESIEKLYTRIQRRLSHLSTLITLPVSYLKVRPGPYTLLSQNLLQIARKVLTASGKKVLYALREGFVFWGEDISPEEHERIAQAYLTGSQEDIKFLELTKITAQKCRFGFVGSLPFTPAVLEEISQEMAPKFLALSPNSDEKIDDFEGFISMTKQLLDSYAMPIDCKVEEGKLYLSYQQKETTDDEDRDFQLLYNLHKVQWLNSKDNKAWKEDFENWQERSEVLEEPLRVTTSAGEVEELHNSKEVQAFILQRVKSTSALYKTYLNFIKTAHILKKEQDEGDIDAHIQELQENILKAYLPEKQESSVKQQLFDRYFECRGNANLAFLEQYAPHIPEKKSMCAFTGALGTIEYKTEVAFAMKARGFCNRTVTTLNNTTSHISRLFVEENKLRASLFKTADANLVLYHDFFEARLDIDRDIIQSCVKAKDEVKLLSDGRIEFDKNAKFQYNFYNMDFVKLAPKVEPTFFLVRKCLRMVQQLGIRSYISGIMTPYTPHRAVFHFDNAPGFLKSLGWDSVRLIHLQEVLDEIRLLLIFGKDRLESNVLKVALNRGAYFTLYYLHNDQNKVYESLRQFYKKYKHKFNHMTVTEKLVELAVEVDVGFESSAEETWMIRTATEYLRTYHKQGSGRDDIIQKTCGELYRKLRMKRPDTEAIKAFCGAVYDELFLKDWKGTIPSVNVEKDWIYQFAFLYREYSLEKVRMPQAKKTWEALKAEGRELTLENVKEALPSKNKRSAEQYLEIIQKLASS